MSLIDTVRIVTDLGIVKVAIVPLNMRNPRWRLQLRLCSLPIRGLPNKMYLTGPMASLHAGYLGGADLAPGDGGLIFPLVDIIRALDSSIATTTSMIRGAAR